jgi:leucine dehydrogenase
MNIFEQMEKEGHEQLMFFQEKDSGLKAILAIHDTTLGPGLGGCRMWPYEKEEDVIMDALRLSKGMTYKSAIAGEDYGGAKTVVWGDPDKDKSEKLFRALGHFINGLGGRYSTGTDVGTTYEDFVYVKKETPYVGALPKEYGGSGDSSIPTSYGVYQGIKACCKYKYGTDSLKGKTIAVQGLGKVGLKVAKLVMDENARVIATDINPDFVEEARKLGAEIVEPDEIFDVVCDIFSPNALGAVINDDTIPRLKCDIIAGAANNVLAEPRHGDKANELGILYAPDYVINGGGLIQVADELSNDIYSEERVMKKCEGIYTQLLNIFKTAEEKDIPTYLAADHLVEERIKSLAVINTIY